jgi:imidazole glycerol phosphate synthase subunit HisF
VRQTVKVGADGTAKKGNEVIKKGDVVRIRKEWQDAGDDQIVFLACEDEDGGRVLIEPQIALEFKPRQVVQVSMLETNE